MEAHPTLEEQIKTAQEGHPGVQIFKHLMEKGKAPKMIEDQQGILWYGKRLFVPHQKELKGLILKEAHSSAYTLHPGSTKMYKDMKILYWWPRMKRDIAEYMSCCDVCQRIKAEHQRPAGCMLSCELLSES